MQDIEIYIHTSTAKGMYGKVFTALTTGIKVLDEDHYR